MTDLTPVINAFIALVAALITAFVIPWVKRNTTAQDREDFLRWVEIAVAAAEQLFYATQGPEKKEYVMQFLEEKGYTVSEDELNAAIEGAVLRLHRQLEEKK
ncbi:holin [Colidextribacter sp. OB.20]|uniref:phage holin, LLH family n=1 Tax=Colidextribacter sp. OB.20 TaxID=2304568 RepID=UPI00136E597E|nr:phage holin, LLH family [Colidextribacter sp. OB.20]NBI11710.1 holin [Colidextribacter sp. OB.20]